MGYFVTHPIHFQQLFHFQLYEKEVCFLFKLAHPQLFLLVVFQDYFCFPHLLFSIFCNILVFFFNYNIHSIYLLLSLKQPTLVNHYETIKLIKLIPYKILLRLPFYSLNNEVNIFFSYIRHPHPIILNPSLNNIDIYFEYYV